MTLEQSIQHFSQTTPDKVAVVCGDSQITYAALWHSITECADRLKAEGLEPDRPYVFRATQDINFLILYCAIHYCQAIAVPLEQSAPQDRFDAILSDVTAHTYSSDIADILYTTGTTGKAKGVMESSLALESCADNFINDLHFTPDLLFIISGPLNHIASLFKIHPVLTVGATVCILDGLKDLNAFFDVFRLPFNKFATFMVPASLRMLMQFSADQMAALADRIDFIETGAAPITSDDMRRLSQLLPHSRLYNTYGGTEIGCMCTYNFNDGRYMEGCVGRPMKNSSVTLTSEGGVVCSGRTIMSGYVGDEEATRQVLRDGCIYGSDLGEFDADGLLHLKGRQGDVINVGGFKVDPAEVESAASTHPSIRECICVADTHPVIGTVLRLHIVLSEGYELDKRAIALHIKSRLEQHKVPTYYDTIPSLARTYNGKVDRKFYKK